MEEIATHVYYHFEKYEQEHYKLFFDFVKIKLKKYKNYRLYVIKYNQIVYNNKFYDFSLIF